VRHRIPSDRGPAEPIVRHPDPRTYGGSAWKQREERGGVLARATAISRQIITRFGMSEMLGPRVFGPASASSGASREATACVGGASGSGPAYEPAACQATAGRSPTCRTSAQSHPASRDCGHFLRQQGRCPQFPKIATGSFLGLLRLERPGGTSSISERCGSGGIRVDLTVEHLDLETNAMPRPSARASRGGRRCQSSPSKTWSVSVSTLKFGHVERRDATEVGRRSRPSAS
jgi:hypothetical protein